MAEALQLQHSLPVVKVRLVDRESRPAVQVELVANVSGAQQVRGSRIDALAAYGFDAPEGTTVPGEVMALVRDWVAEEIDPDRSGDPVLWLHLVKPYGLLGTVPWERDLHEHCGIPLLRLPDVLPAADREASSYAIALCVAHEDPQAEDIARAVQAGAWDAHVHVFTTRDVRAALREALPAANFTIHEAGFGSPRTRTAPRGRRNSWLDWVRNAVFGMTIDAVHFVAQGRMLGLEGALLLPNTAKDCSEYAEPVQVAELRAFLTDVGAIVAGFSAPTPNWSPGGLLKLVDELGAIRAGPVVLHDGGTPYAGQVLTEVYSLLSTPEPGRPPSDPDLVLFAQPRQIETTRPENAPDLRSAVLRPSAAVEERLRDAETPQWVAAAERFIAEQEAELIRFRQSAELARPTSAQVAHYDGVSAALEKIRSAVDQQVGGTA